MFNSIYYRHCLLLIAGITILAAACKKENNNIKPLPDIVITTPAITEKSIGDTVTISPTIDYGGQAATFTYKWFRYASRPNYVQVLELVSEHKDFVQVMDSLGTYQVREEVTNVATGVTAAITLSWNVVSRAERGWYVLKGTADGNTDMDAFLISSNGASTNTNIISAKYGNPLSGTPVGLAFTSLYNYLEPVSHTFYQNNSCLMPMSSKEFLAYRIKDEKVLANSDQLFYEVPPLATRNYQGLVADPNLMVLVNNGRAQGMNPKSNSFLPERTGNYSLSPYFTITPSAGSTDVGYVMGFDKLSESFVTVRFQQTDVTYFPDEYLNSSGGGQQYNISANHLGGQLVFLENTDGSLDTLLTTNGRAYGLLKRDNSSDMVLLGLNLAELIPSRYNGAHSPIRYADTLLASQYPNLTSASLYALNKNNPILYFANANKIGAYSIDSKNYIDNLYSFPAGEEITYMKFINCQYDTPASYNFTNLVVATYSGGNYKIYQFNVLGNTLNQTGSVYQGTGRVKTMLYTTPNTTSFYYSMYRYY
ncbi:hypothetical protein GA0116948_10917 [Chitinophaga costaii]|uniref:PKD-like family protein n=1 Tax=Chitinophaga costaii TaxID=1335309 RepID=A0A1C4ELK5_9BACT|nr:PKD-like family lipoprotein [Chitinophaga costaii]PUZ22428.1 hypothetical protein DCM91_14245 [Chitinophaga costaii]SCC44478.1 hypothetical protein GA0116948_10917 [Chitinophaga costaii]